MKTIFRGSSSQRRLQWKNDGAKIDTRKTGTSSHVKITKTYEGQLHFSMRSQKSILKSRMNINSITSIYLGQPTGHKTTPDFTQGIQTVKAEAVLSETKKLQKLRFWLKHLSCGLSGERESCPKEVMTACLSQGLQNDSCDS